MEKVNERQRLILNDVLEERSRQDEKWGEQNHNAFVWLSILGEEIGEVSQAALHAWFGKDDWSDYRKELIQVAAVAVSMLECLDYRPWAIYRKDKLDKDKE